MRDGEPYMTEDQKRTAALDFAIRQVGGNDVGSDAVVRVAQAFFDFLNQ